ncbi:conjugal transfer protein [Cupriavidus pauculus]|uniref:conjugal transfer protein n=1 Tax=Cupriavidus pauculus TaxID=82633 RepID=UPI001EE29D8A|nr:conjugal transfer protein [Cupriavidus pauculus]GJG97763.1 conjugal transfer protein [Cupriavidus pauculus]
MRARHVSIGLSRPRQIGGAVRGLAIANGTIVALLVYVTFRSGWKIPLAVIAMGMAHHALLRWLTSIDPWWNQVLGAYNRYGDWYEAIPWHGKTHTLFRRPYGFDSELPC